MLRVHPRTFSDRDTILYIIPFDLGMSRPPSAASVPGCIRCCGGLPSACEGRLEVRGWLEGGTADEEGLWNGYRGITLNIRARHILHVGCS